MKNPLILLVVLLFVLGCGNSTSVSTGNAPQIASGVRRVNINQAKTFDGLDVTVGEIALESGKVTVGVTLTNKTKETLTVYPDQGEIIIGKSQFESNMFMATGDLGGEIHAGVEKRGSLAFIGDNIDTATKQIDLRLGKVYGGNMMKQTDVHWIVDLP